MKFNYFPFAVAMMMACAACTVNRVVPGSEFVSYNLPADQLHSVDISGSVRVEFTQAETVSVKVECPDNVADLLTVTVNDGTLKAGFKPNTAIDGNCGVTITVTAPTLRSVDASSASRFDISGALVQDCSLEIEASSSAHVSLYKLSLPELEIDASSSASVSVSDVRCQSVEADASSAASITLSGEAHAAEYDASSAASINAKGLQVETLKSVSASSAATISYTAANCLYRSATSGAKVTGGK